MKRNSRKLALNKETLRNLQDSELRQVVGGVARAAFAAFALEAHPVTETSLCPTGSCILSEDVAIGGFAQHNAGSEYGGNSHGGAG